MEILRAAGHSVSLDLELHRREMKSSFDFQIQEGGVFRKETVV
jgi:hypothetical protein